MSKTKIENTPEQQPTDPSPMPQDAPESVPQSRESNTSDEVVESSAEPDKPGGREARFRKELRETQTERDTLQDRLAAAQRGLVDHLAATDGRIKPDALWASDVAVEDLLDDAGNVDRAKVAEACDSAADTLGLTRRPRPDVGQGRSTPVDTSDRWAGAFAPQN